MTWEGFAVLLSNFITQSWPLSYKVETNIHTIHKFVSIEIIHQVTIPVEIYFLSSLGQRCSVYEQTLYTVYEGGNLSYDVGWFTAL